MKENARFDSFITVSGLMLLVALFGFVVYLPGIRAAATTHRQIAASEQLIREVPLRLAELQALKDQIKMRTDYLEGTSHLMPSDADAHSVLRQVADLATDSDLKVTRLEPATPIPHKTYTIVPFQISFTGRFRGIAAFLTGLEQSRRLLTVEEFILKGKPQSTGENTEADVHFSVYVQNAEFSDSNENNTSSSVGRVDTGIR